MLSCREIFELSSRQPLETLSLQSRLGIRFHGIMCKMCRHYWRQIRLVDSLLCKQAELDQRELGPEARQRILGALKNDPDLGAAQ